MQQSITQNQNTSSRPSVHHVLAQSYFVYFALLLAGVFLDLLFPDKIFASSMMMPTGFLVLVLASMVIFWAQHTSHKLDRSNITKESFCSGPYCYTRTPTHWGLFLLTLGFGLVLNAFFVIVFSVISFLITKFFFLRKEERILADRYGQPYLEYKRSVKF